MLDISFYYLNVYIETFLGSKNAYQYMHTKFPHPCKTDAQVAPVNLQIQIAS